MRGIDSNGHTATDTAQATVTPSLTPGYRGDQGSQPADPSRAGRDLHLHRAGVQPSATDPIKITSLTDNIYGDLATRPGSTCGTLIGVILAPGAVSAPCSFTGPFTGHAGDSQTDTVTVRGVDSFGNTATPAAQATVALTPVNPEISVTKAANPLSLPVRGGTFTFTVQVHNPSTVDPVKITSLVDNIYGDLATRPGSTCGALIGTTLAPGATSAPCSFTGPFNGTVGQTQTDIVTVKGVDQNGTPVTASATATLTPVNPANPVIAVTKAANPLTLPQPGGTFTFTVTASNPGPDPVKITTLTDNIYGDLATRPGSTCGALIGITLAPGATSQPCSFTGQFNGAGGASQTDIVTVTGQGSNGTLVTATAKATVGITAPPPGPPLAFTGFNGRQPLALAGGLILMGILLLTTTWWWRRYNE